MEPCADNSRAPQTTTKPTELPAVPVDRTQQQQQQPAAVPNNDDDPIDTEPAAPPAEAVPVPDHEDENVAKMTIVELKNVYVHFSK